VWEELKKTDPQIEALFACSRRAEDSGYLRAAGVEPHPLTAPKFGWRFPLGYLRSNREAKQLLRRFRPDTVFSKGGSVSVPLCMAAKRRGIPVILHESDAVMGRANRLLTRVAETVCLGLPSAKREDEWIVTGNPVRPSVTQGMKDDGYALTGLTEGKPVLLITGGSQGSQAFNDWVVENLDELLGFTQVIHLTGSGKRGGEPRKGYCVVPFADSELKHFYAIADLAVSRGGSGNIAELAACGIPTIVVPLRGLAQDHQYFNAKAAAENGGCILMDQERIKGELVPLVRVTLEDSGSLQRMREQMKGLYHPDAAKRLAEIVRKAAENHLPRRGKRR
jgi:UDP-N-acetylglucosamine--N-acetylmuramyl-(pentapeptide) pyrophosphoryl-undecaprenol N-acetylglucosamine transferase